MDTRDARCREEIIEFGKRLTARGMVGTFEGNISVLDREHGRLYITPSGRAKDTLTPEMIVVTDPEGNCPARRDGLKASSEIVMHARMYAMRPDMNACIHCHAPFSTAFALNHTPIRTDAMAELRVMYGGEVPVLPYGEPGTEHLVDGYEKHRDKSVVLLANHGMLALGRDLDEAYGRTVTVEMIAKTLFISRLMGTNVPIPPEELEKLDKIAERTAAERAH